MEFQVLKLDGLMKQYRPITFIISKDEFFYKKKKNTNNFQTYHISYLNEIYVEKQVKQKSQYNLIIEINNKFMKKKKGKKDNKIIKLTMKDDKSANILSNIKKILNVKRLQYDMNLFLYNYRQKMDNIFNNDIFNIIKDEKAIFNIKNSFMEKIEKKYDKEKINDLLKEKLNNFIKFLNQSNLDISLLDEDIIKKIREIINGTFILENEENNNEDVLKEFKNIETFYKIYLNLIKLFTQIKYGYILKRFKQYDKKYLFEYQKINMNQKYKKINDDEIKIKTNINSLDNIEETKIIYSDIDKDINDKDNKNEINENDIDSKIIEKKEQNKLIQTKMLGGLTSNSKMKDNLKRIILKQNKKLYLCIKCNSLLVKTLLDKSNCNFDKTCTNRSFFYCKKCKLHLCTKCIVYQRGMKCSKNHKYFQKPMNSKEELVCLICGNSKNFPFYECKHCNEQICSECSVGSSTREYTCHNCNNELTWKKCIYTTCDRCRKLTDCFFNCLCCDYSICINCTSLPNNYCGAMHKLEEINLMDNYFYNDNINDENVKLNNTYCFNYEVLFYGKCSWCNKTIGRSKIWACLRCSLFICDNCIKRSSE